MSQNNKGMLRYTFQDRLFLQWSIYAGVLSFILWLSWHLGYLISIFLTDPTRLTFLISFLFLGGSLHCGIRARYLSSQINSINNIESGEASYSTETSLPAEFLNTIKARLKDQDLDDNNSADNVLLSEVFAEQAHAQHEIGWFFTPPAAECQRVFDSLWLERYPRPKEIRFDNGNEFKAVLTETIKTQT